MARETILKTCCPHLLIPLLCRIHRAFFYLSFLGLILTLQSSVGFALESTAVLPKDVRRVQTILYMSEFDSFSNKDGRSIPLASSLEQPIHFQELVDAQSKETSASVRAFLNSQGISLDTEAGRFAADLKAGVQAVGVSFAWGLSDRFTIGLGAPLIRAETKVDIALQPTPAASGFLLELQKAEYGQRRNAALAVREVNAAPEAMQEVLEENGYQRVEDWWKAGFGDTTLAGRYRFHKGTSSSAVAELGVVIPTGATDDPDILTDIPLGDGQWDVFSQVVVDSKIFGNATASANIRYTEQLPGKMDLRLRTKDELIAVPNAEVTLDRGSKIDLGLGYSQPLFSELTAYSGYQFSMRGQDKYRDLPNASKNYYETEKGRPLRTQTLELGLGYSTVESYQRGKFPIPFKASTSYFRQTVAKNTAYDADRVQLELSVFF